MILRLSLTHKLAAFEKKYGTSKMKNDQQTLPRTTSNAFVQTSKVDSPSSGGIMGFLKMSRETINRSDQYLVKVSGGVRVMLLNQRLQRYYVPHDHYQLLLTLIPMVYHLASYPVVPYTFYKINNSVTCIFC